MRFHLPARLLHLLLAFLLLAGPLTGAPAGAQSQPHGTPPGPAVTATKSDALLIDQDGDGKAAPGDTLRYTVHVANAGPGDATGLTVADTLDPNTSLVPGSIESTPLAYDQAVATAEDTPLTLTLTGSDADGDPLTFMVTVPPANGTLSGSAPNLVYTPAPGYQGADRLTFQVCDTAAPPACDTAAIDIQIAGLNDQPSFTGGPDQTVAEDAGPQSLAGWATSISPGPPDEAGQVLTFVVTNNTNPALFASGPALAADGTLSYTPAANANGSATITLELRDDGGTLGGGIDTSVPYTFLITVTPVNDQPVVAPATLSIAENSPVGAVAGTVSFSDPDAGQTHSFSITAGNTAGAFAIDPTTGEITVANSAALDLESSPSFALTIQVSDDGTPVQSGTALITVNLTNVNETPVVNDQAFGPLAENSSNGASVETVVATDGDGPPLAYSITAGNTGGAFAINPATGAITVANSAALDFETSPSFALTVQVSDGAFSDTATITISLADVNEAPLSLTLSDSSVAENLPVGTVVGNLSASDPDAGQTHTFTLVAGAGDTDNALFQIVAGQLQTNASFDFEAQSSYSIRVRATDSGAPALFVEQQFTLTIVDADDPPAPASTRPAFAPVGAAPSGFPLAIGILPAGKSITITFDVVIGAGLPDRVRQVRNQATVSGSNFAAVLSDDPGTAAPADPTVTALDFGYFVYLPLVTQSASAGLPDLVVDRISATSGTVQVTIRNQGSRPATTPFWIDVYINPRMPPSAVNQIWQTLADQGLVWGVAGPALPLDPGESLTLNFNDAYYHPERSLFGGSLSPGAQLYAQVDSANSVTSYGGVLESHEAAGGRYNNIAGPFTLAAGLAPAAVTSAPRAPEPAGLPARP